LTGLTGYLFLARTRPPRVAKHCGQVSLITLFLLDRIYRIDWILLLPLTLSRRKDENQSAYRRKKMLRDTGMFLIPLSQQLVYFIVTKPKLTRVMGDVGNTHPGGRW